MVGGPVNISKGLLTEEVESCPVLSNLSTKEISLAKLEGMHTSTTCSAPLVEISWALQFPFRSVLNISRYNSGSCYKWIETINYTKTRLNVQVKRWKCQVEVKDKQFPKDVFPITKNWDSNSQFPYAVDTLNKYYFASWTDDHNLVFPMMVLFILTATPISNSGSRQLFYYIIFCLRNLPFKW